MHGHPLQQDPQYHVTPRIHLLPWFLQLSSHYSLIDFVIVFHFTTPTLQTKLDLASIITIWRKKYNHILCGPLAKRLPWALVPSLVHARVIRNKPHRACHTTGSLGLTVAIILKPCTCLLVGIVLHSRSIRSLIFQ